MDCYKFREELDLDFPSLDLSGEEKHHVEGCAPCQQYLHMMQTMTAIPGKEEAFSLGALEIERLVASVNYRIDDSLPKEPTPGFRLRQLVPLVAAVVLIVSVSLVSLYVYDDSSDNAVDGALGEDSFYALLNDPNNAELDERIVEILLDDFTSEHTASAGELLLDDLTEEEFNYLMNNYDVGELL